MAKEIERKYLNVPFDLIRQRMTLLGASNLGARFESNAVFDSPDQTLFNSGRLLRLRLNEWPAKSSWVLTLKLRPDAASGNVKSREEFEIEVTDGHTLEVMLANLGYHLAARYEKVRESWKLRLPGGACAEIELDILPFGQFVEVEAAGECLDDVATLLGLDNFQISLKTYHELNQDWIKAAGLPIQPSFEFTPARRKELRAFLGLAN